MRLHSHLVATPAVRMIDEVYSYGLHTDGNLVVITRDVN